jgi:hypothetical protein
MSDPSHMPWIRREDYDAFRRLSPRDDYFPDTFDEWLRRMEEAISNEEAHGRRVNNVEVDPQQFVAWCTASGVNPNSATLNAFTVGEAHKRKS